MNKVLRFSLADIDQAICVSHTSKENTVLRSGLPPAKVFMILNAVDNATFKPASVRPSTDDVITIVVISRLVYRKGADLLVVAIPKVCRLYPNVHFIVGGDGPKHVRLEEMREKHCLQDRVEMLGSVPHSHVLPGDMVRAIEKAISILSSINPEEMHNRMKKLYSWQDVAKRTVIVYDRALKCSNRNLL